jgi:serine/threonine protein kinase
LCEYWEQEKMPEFTEQIVLWSLRQMAGLASGLSEIHNFGVPCDFRAIANASPREARYGLHGDIKPRNILYFRQRPNYEDPTGVLQITDFGLVILSQSKLVPSSTVTVSPTYAPPDSIISIFVSCAYDMWCLGCVYLEFISWLILGFEAIHEFSNCRESPGTNIHEIADDLFYTMIGDTAFVRQGVIDWVRKLKQQQRCSQALLDLLELVMSQLIVIEPRKRISSEQLYGELSTIINRAQQDAIYLLSPINHGTEPQNVPISHWQSNVPIHVRNAASTAWPLKKTSSW